MKELWIEVDGSLSEEQKSKLLNSAAKSCDVLLVDTADVENAKKTGRNTVGVGGRQEQGQREENGATCPQ